MANRLPVVINANGHLTELTSGDDLDLNMDRLKDVGYGTGATQYDVLIRTASAWALTPTGAICLRHSSAVTPTSTYAAMPWNTSAQKWGNFTHSTSTNNSEIECDADGIVECNISMTFRYVSGGNDWLVRMKLQRHNGTSWSDITGTERQGQILGVGGGSETMSINWLEGVSDGDKIRVMIQAQSVGGATEIPAGFSSIVLKYVPKGS